MIQLPLELQLLVVESLDPLDIVHLEQVCRALRDLVRNSGSVIWRDCLFEHCIRNEVFWPSYGHLESAEEFKLAATASIRFERSFKRAVTSGQPIERTSHLIQLVGRPTREEIEDAYFVPGGRFLILFERMYMSIWDLSEAPAADLVFSMSLNQFNMLGYRNLVRNENIHLILELLPDDYPESYIPNELEDGITALQFIDLSLNEDAVFNTKHDSRLTLIHPFESEAEAYSIIGDRVILLINERTIVWNHVENTYTGWKLGGAKSRPVEIYSNTDYVFYICHEGIYGVRFPEMKAIEDGYIVAKDLHDVLEPSFFIAHDHPYDHSFTGNVIDIPSNIFELENCKPVDGRHPVFYDIRQVHHRSGNENQAHDEERTCDIELHRHKFVFNPADPPKSVIEKTKSFKCSVPETPERVLPQSLHANYYRLCDGKTAAIWKDALLPPTFISLTDGGYDTQVNLPFVPFTVSEDVPNSLLLEGWLCPASNKALIIWDEQDIIENDDGDGYEPTKQWVKLYEFI